MKKTKAPEPSGKSGRKTGLALYHPTRRILFIFRKDRNRQSAGPFSHSPIFGQRPSCVGSLRMVPGLFLPRLYYITLFFDVKLGLTNFPKKLRFRFGIFTEDRRRRHYFRQGFALVPSRSTALLSSRGCPCAVAQHGTAVVKRLPLCRRVARHYFRGGLALPVFVLFRLFLSFLS